MTDWNAALLGRGNFEAMTQSTQAYLTGVQGFSRQYFVAVQGLMQQAAESAKTLAGVKSLRDAMAVQAELSRASVDRAMAESAKLQQAALTLTEQVYAPLTRCTTTAVEQTTFSRAA